MYLEKDSQQSKTFTIPPHLKEDGVSLSNLMKNRYLSKPIKDQGFYEFKRQIKYKCELRGIEFILADRFFPSSKTCSNCGKIKKDLKLSDRIYSCECGLSINRDLNASINLSNYKLA